MSANPDMSEALLTLDGCLAALNGLALNVAEGSVSDAKARILSDIFAKAANIHLKRQEGGAGKSRMEELLERLVEDVPRPDEGAAPVGH